MNLFLYLKLSANSVCMNRWDHFGERLAFVF